MQTRRSADDIAADCVTAGILRLTELSNSFVMAAEPYFRNIRVKTGIEMNEKKDRIEDALYAAPASGGDF